MRLSRENTDWLCIFWVSEIIVVRAVHGFHYGIKVTLDGSGEHFMKIIVRRLNVLFKLVPCFLLITVATGRIPSGYFYLLLLIRSSWPHSVSLLSGGITTQTAAIRTLDSVPI